MEGRRLRAAQPVALLVGPRDPRSLHRRCRPGHVGGGRRAHARPATGAEQLRLARLGGPLALHARPEGEPAREARLPDRHLQARERKLLDHGRLRLPGSRSPVGARSVLLRRLLHRQDLESARGAREAARRRARRAVPGLGALVVRRGRGRRAVRDLARRHRLQARPAALLHSFA